MGGILCAGLTPAWQQIVELQRFRHGHVNRALDVHLCASGKSINVAMALGSLNAPCRSLSLAGGVTGQQLRDDLRDSSIQAEWVETAAATRVCTTIVERDSGVTTELVENAAAISAPEWRAFRERYRQLASGASMAVLSGSLPPGVTSDCYADLLAETAVPAIVDARGVELLAALSRSPLVVKPNREELAFTAGHSIETDAQLLAAMRRLNDQGAGWVLVTDGPRTVWLTSSDESYRCEPPAIQPVNAIGSGDCLTAGLAFGIDQGHSMTEALKLGVACAIENALVLLPARVERQRVLARASQVVVERV